MKPDTDSSLSVLSIRELQRLTGIGRTTIYEQIKRAPCLLARLGGGRSSFSKTFNSGCGSCHVHRQMHRRGFLRQIPRKVDVRLLVSPTVDKRGRLVGGFESRSASRIERHHRVRLLRSTADWPPTPYSMRLQHVASVTVAVPWHAPSAVGYVGSNKARPSCAFWRTTPSATCAS